MGNVYYMVDLDRKKYIEYMDAEVQKNCASFMEMMNATFEKAPVCDRIKELQDFLQERIKAHVGKLEFGQTPRVLNETLAIGTATNGQFYWRRDNGFLTKEDVGKYLEEHPYCEIYDADENPVTYEAFCALFN